jgi:hypothetical protein
LVILRKESYNKSSSWQEQETTKTGGAGPTENGNKTPSSDVVDHPPHPPLPLDMIGVSTVPIGGAVDHDLPHILLAAVTVAVKAMIVKPTQGSIKRSQNGEAKAKVKNGVDRPTKGKANINTATAAMTVGKKRRRKRSHLKVIDHLKGIDHHLYHHHQIPIVGTMMIQMFEDQPFQVKRSKCTLTKQKMIW